MVTTISQMSLLLLSLYLISSYDCRHHGDDPYPNYGSKRASRFYNEIFLPPAQALRSDRSDYESYVSRGENERVSEITAEAPYEIQGSNERFIAVHSEVWRAKKEDMKRFQDRYRVDETVLRTVSGSIKIVNLPKTYSSLTSKGGQLVKRRPSDDRVVFPAPPVEPMLYVPEIPESCKTMKICDNVINYPRELANKFIAELGDKRDMFNIDKEEDEVEQRNSADQSFRLCSFTEKVVMAPRAAQSLNGDWLFVLNDEDSPLQNYKVEVCKVIFLNVDWTTCKARAMSVGVDWCTGKRVPVCSGPRVVPHPDANEAEIDAELDLYFTEAVAELRAAAGMTAVEINAIDLSVEEIQTKIQAAVIAAPEYNIEPYQPLNKYKELRVD